MHAGTMASQPIGVHEWYWLRNNLQVKVSSQMQNVVERKCATYHAEAQAAG